MVGVLIAGMLCGLMVSAPIGPMAMVTALRWAEHHYREATLLAIGVAVGDFTLAVLAALVFLVPDNLPKLPHLWLVLMAVVLLLSMAVYTWRESDKPVRPINGHAGFFAAIALTMSHPGNIAALFGLYAGLVPSVSGVLVGEMRVVQVLLLLVGVACGLALGWSLFLTIVDGAVRRYGKLPLHLRMWLARGISVILVLGAIGLVAAEI